jgi:hypothetical protein
VQGPPPYGPPPGAPPYGPPPGAPPYGPPPGPPGGFAPPPAGSYGYPQIPPQPSGEAIAALVCGIMAFTGCFPLGFVAVWLGARARRAARENPGQVGGEQLALVGMIVGGAMAAIYTLVIIGYVIFVVFIIGVAATSGP